MYIMTHMETQAQSRFHYPPVSISDRASGMIITSAGESTIPPHNPYPPHGHPGDYSFVWRNGRTLSEFALVLISEGGGMLENIHGNMELVPGNLFALLPHEWHRYRPHPSTGWKEHWICFQGAHPEFLAQTGFLDALRPASYCGGNCEIPALFNRVLELVMDESAGYQPVAAALTLEIMAHTHAQMRLGARGESNEPLVARARILLNERLDRQVNMERLAQELGMGYSWLRKKFKQHTGMAMHQYHMQARISRARLLLRDTSMTIQEISDTLGFDSPFYFSRMFKKKTGVSPFMFRQGIPKHSHLTSPGH